MWALMSLADWRSCCQSGISSTRSARLSRMMLVAWCTLARSWSLPSACVRGDGEGGGGGGFADADAHRGVSPVLARISARCMVRTRRAGAMQSAVDLHQAGVVEGGDDFGAGLEDAGVFFGEHGGGDIGVFDGEGAAEAAALFLIRELDELEAADRAEELRGAVADVQHAERVAGGVIGDALRRSARLRLRR